MGRSAEERSLTPLTTDALDPSGSSTLAAIRAGLAELLAGGGLVEAGATESTEQKFILA